MTDHGGETPRRSGCSRRGFGALLVVAALGAAALWLERREADPATSTVPSVTGLAEDDAVERLGRAGFTVSANRRPVDGTREGVVATQDPPGGAESSSGAIVTLRVSTGPATSAVPDVTGLRAASAEAALRRVGRNARRVPVYSDAPQGEVVGQSPGAGVRALRGQPVQLGVSRGTTRRVTVPRVVGRSARDAGRVLRRAALGAPVVVRLRSTARAGTIVRQSPVAGSQLAEGSRIRVGVSDGRGPAVAAPDNPHMPIVVGFSEAEALRELETFGYLVRIAYRRAEDPGGDGVVVEQEPQGGGPRGSVVTLVVGAADLR